MSNLMTPSIAVAVTAAALFSLPAAGQAQSSKIRDADTSTSAKPDFSGFWSSPIGAKGPGITIFDKDKMAPLKPGGESLYEGHTGDVHHDEPRAFCAPSGFPWGMLSPYPVQILVSHEYIVIVHEFQRMTRIIPMDGRPHRTDVEPSYQGDSVAHWEGDTLVIDTTNFKRWPLDDYHYFDSTNTRMHSDALHTVEHLRLKDSKALDYQITIDDPKVFTGPWSQDFEMKPHPEWAKTGLFEFACTENNRCAGGRCSANTE